MSQLNAEALLADLAVSAQPCQARRGSLRLDFAHTSGCEQSVRHSNRFAILCARGGGIFSMLDPSECNRRPPPPQCLPRLEYYGKQVVNDRLLGGPLRLFHTWE